jgi:hypothetical protein
MTNKGPSEVHRTPLGSTSPQASDQLVLPAVASDSANIKELFRILWAKANWADRAARTLRCTKRHVYRLTTGERRLTPRSLSILDAVASERIRRRREDIAHTLALAHLHAGEERGRLPWAPSVSRRAARENGAAAGR